MEREHKTNSIPAYINRPTHTFTDAKNELEAEIILARNIHASTIS